MKKNKVEQALVLGPLRFLTCLVGIRFHDADAEHTTDTRTAVTCQRLGNIVRALPSDNGSSKNGDNTAYIVFGCHICARLDYFRQYTCLLTLWSIGCRVCVASQATILFCPLSAVHSLGPLLVAALVPP